jgi:hypothetical protein
MQELGTVMMRLGERPSEQELRIMVAEVDQVGRALSTGIWNRK